MVDQLVDEVRDADLADERLNERLVKIIERFDESPNLSTPAPTTSRAEVEAAYCFFRNEKASSQKILASHAAQTLRRMAEQSVVLMVQDTTEIDLTRPTQPVQGAGPVDCKERRGEFFYPLMAFHADGVPPEIVWHKLWTREKIETTASREGKKSHRDQTPIADKESIGWLEGLRAARDTAAECPATTCICVSDSESDASEIFDEPRQSSVDGASSSPIHLLIRACQNRCTENGCLLDEIRKQPCLFSNTIRLTARQAKTRVTQGRRAEPRDVRTAEVEVRAATVTLQPPERFDRKLPALKMNAVLVEEQNAPPGTHAVQWLLATTLPTDTLEQVRMIVEYYCIRWQIEVHFRTLKSGCRVEERQFETLSRNENSLAVYGIVA